MPLVRVVDVGVEDGGLRCQVDVSPLSTPGASSVAALADPAGARDLFRKVMTWGCR